MFGTDIDLKDLSALGGAGGALIAAISYWWKTRHERRRATRTALFYLLELHHVLRRVYAASRWLKFELGPSLKASLRSRGIELNESEFTSMLAQVMPAFNQFGRSQIERSVAGMAEGLARSLVDLAKEDPVLAFRLRGRDQLLLMPQHVEQIAAGQTASQPPGSSDSGWADAGEFFTTVSLEDLENAIRSTAKRCDLCTRFRVWKLLRSAADDRDIKSVIQRLVDKAAASIAAQKQ
ncbi:hypothetical protein H8N03_06865 [Ramlibacter sp. USB13]|uniref:Uncharacterized protein n=1 Tax=Ramlibacter cellulosilyticus TaxID=2764187 RepID=A0A923MNM4_9BURK|nr:hypothetical protein [Ramlibacter cellulosilyticus]MBC5782660.1 hypothetical protein [Ramlibacter cellulosilyticus]